MTDLDSTVERSCLFCNKLQSEVKLLIVPKKDSGVGICDSCAKLCLDLMLEKHMKEVDIATSLKKQHDPEVLKDGTNLTKPEAT